MTTKEEYAERRERWIAALESGKYRQTDQALHNDGGFCCLGVACDLFRRDQHKGRWRRSTDGDFEILGKVDLLPREVQDWLGLRSSEGKYREATPTSTGASLAMANDDGDPFHKIASIIRAELSNLFIPEALP